MTQKSIMKKDDNKNIVSSAKPKIKLSNQLSSIVEEIEKVEENKTRVTYGANDEELNIPSGTTVAKIRKSLSEAWKIPADAEALVDGNTVDEDYVIKNSDALEFFKVSGVKGI